VLLEQERARMWIPSTEIDKSAVREQLDRLLSDPYFSHSKRYPSFLKFVVECALEGQIDSLKERVLGIEVFERAADYDTTVDPIVRVTAAEIRKRILKYNKDPRHKDELRISIPIGSYVPNFELPETWASQTASASDGDKTAKPAEKQSATDLQPLSPEIPLSEAPLRAYLSAHSSAYLLIALSVAATLLIGISGFSLWKTYPHSSVEAFWSRLLRSPNPVLFCIADQSAYATVSLLDASNPAPKNGKLVPDHPVTVDMDDTFPLVQIASMVQSHGHPIRILGHDSTTFTDMWHGPVVLIGAFDNSWTLRVTNPLRFHFANTPDMEKLWIEDREHPKQRTWLSGTTVSDGESAIRKDYALVARFTEPDTGQLMIVAAGLGNNGTAAAGEFLLSSPSLSELDHLAPKNWQSKNIEVILETTVVDGHAGPPHIDAIHTW
jgi:hypothetical protein